VKYALARLIKLNKRRTAPEWLKGSDWNAPYASLMKGHTNKVPPVIIDELVEESPAHGIPLRLPWKACLFDYPDTTDTNGVGRYGALVMPSEREGWLKGLFMLTAQSRLQGVGFLCMEMRMSECGSFDMEIETTGDDHEAMWFNMTDTLVKQLAEGHPEITEERALEITAYSVAAPVVCALQRLACSNVEAVPRAQLQLAKKRKRRSVKQGMSYRVLVVRSKDGTIRTLSPRKKDGEAKVRFHTRRGHYRDYRKGKGLFGKLSKLVWVESHACGNKSMGEIRKGYKIEGKAS
jgi:hypothetical protein